MKEFDCFKATFQAERNALLVHPKQMYIKLEYCTKVENVKVFSVTIVVFPYFVLRPNTIFFFLIVIICIFSELATGYQPS